MRTIPYRGAAPAIQDVLAGNLSFMVDTFTPLLPMHRDGQLKIISVFGTERAAVAPEIPTAREEGFDGSVRSRAKRPVWLVVERW